MAEVCESCPRHCKVDRKKDVGFCNESGTIRIAKIIDNFMWEEPCVTDKNGVCAIFFSGCNLKCDFCQNYEISNGQVGKLYTKEDFISLLKEKEKTNSYFDFVTPTHFSQTLLEILQKYKPKIPIIWNTSGYEDLDMLKQLDKYINIYLIDFKYSSDEIGKKYSKCYDYFSKLQPILKFIENTKQDVFENGYLKQGIIIRHLVLPGEIENSKKFLDFIKANYSTRIISLMSQFTPTLKSTIKRKLLPIEYKIILSHLDKLGLQNGYLQEFSSADSSFIPKFLD